MELEVGMYVRTRYGRIYNIENIETKKVYYSCNPLEHQWQDIKFIYGERGMECTEAIKKASHNIIDLIQIGDVIVDEIGYKYPINFEFETDYNNEYESYEITIDDRVTLFFKDGLSIVTKEQFESMSYKVK